MKTRVVRHWAHTEWVYTVQTWVQVSADDIFVKFHGNDSPTPAVGSWRWDTYIVPGAYGAPGIYEFSRSRATEIAHNLSYRQPVGDADVVMTFGE